MNLKLYAMDPKPYAMILKPFNLYHVASKLVYAAGTIDVHPAHVAELSSKNAVPCKPYPLPLQKQHAGPAHVAEQLPQNPLF